MIYLHTYIRKSNVIVNLRRGVVLFLKVGGNRPTHNNFKQFSYILYFSE